MSLFAAAAARSSHLVEFNAGKCIIEGNLIKPDVRKGLVYMEQGEDQLLHFYWKERNKNQASAEDDWIIFPDEAEFTKVSQCTTGRVYLLRFKISNERHFYWMQNKSEDTDQEVVDRVNNLIRDPETNMSSEFDESASHAELMRLLNDVGNQDPNVTSENILQFLNNMNRSSDEEEEEEEEREAESNRSPTAAVDQEFITPVPTNTTSISNDIPATNTTATTSTVNATQASTAPVSTPSNNEQQQQLEQFRQILANLNNNNNGSIGASSISLNDVLNPQTLRPLLNDTTVRESLMDYLPEESEKTAEEVRAIIASPQFSQSLHTFTSALNTGQLGPLLAQFGLDPSILGVESFLEAINEQAKKDKKDKMDTTD
ncbi:MAG: proteasome complex subunit Rpn13 ubiquitin receptor-domain-containing protein [Benjaminiella poitrasii]|nr:MAG: proteasome complex subunit Rpn13 ubiquitin receptor-domain-containing protein [Benjaminiella poitrasii]